MNIRTIFNKIMKGLVGGIHARHGMVLKPKTIQQALDEYWPDSSFAARDELLWLTPYPFVGAEEIIDSLREMRDKWGPAIGDAINGEMKEFDRAFSEYNRMNPQ